MTGRAVLWLLWVQKDWRVLLWRLALFMSSIRSMTHRALVVVVVLLCGYLTAAVPQGKKGPGGRQGGPYIDDIALSDINILLPCSSSVSVSYQLEAYNGCFKWESRKPEVVGVEPQLSEVDGDGSCSTSALIFPLCSQKQRASSFVIAEDVVTGRRLRCEVYVDHISRIEILTTNRMMYRDDVELLEIQAFDPNGNLFSTLEGLEFQWSIFPYSKPGSATSPSAPSSTSVLKFQAFRDSTKEISPVLLQMEEQGIETGKANVAARLMERGYDNVAQTTVELSVLEPLTLVPSHRLYLSPGSAMKYGLQTLTSDATARDIRMPNPLYVWSTSNKTVATVNDRGLVDVLDLGRTDVRVQVESLEENYDSAEVMVVLPAYITLKIVPFSSEGDAPSTRTSAASANFYLISGLKYKVMVEVYDSDSHKISATDNLKFTMELSTEHFVKLESSENDGRHTVQTTREGTTLVTATLQAMTNLRNGTRHPLNGISVRHDVMISAPIRISPSPRVLLPWDRNFVHQYSLTARGGSGEYTWKSADSTVVSVSAFGVLTTQSKGSSTIKATDPKNPSNMDQVEVAIAQVGALEIVPRVLEVEIGDSSVVLPLAAYTSPDPDSQLLFDNCSALPVQWTLSDPDVMTLLPLDPAEGEAIEGSCAQRRVVALKEGQCRISVEYNGLTAHTTLFAFRPLRVLEPVAKVITLGSSSTIMFTGGPNPWYYDSTTYRTSLEVENEPALRVERVRLTDDAVSGTRRLLEEQTDEDDGATVGWFAYHVTCLRHHEQTLKLTVGNRPSQSNPHPLSRTTTSHVSCKHPSNVLLYPVAAVRADAAEGTALDCQDASWSLPTTASIDEGVAVPAKYRVRCSQALPFRLVVLNDQMTPYTNFSSLQFDWMTTNATMALWGDISTESPATSVDVASFSLQRQLLLGPHEGSMQVQVRLVGHDQEALRKVGCSRNDITAFDQELPKLKKSVRITLLPNVHLDPAGQITMLQSSQNSVRLVATGGSGHRVLSVSPSGVVSFLPQSTAEEENGLLVFTEASEDPSAVLAVPHSSGDVVVTVEDPCLVGSELVTSNIRVSGVSQLKIASGDLLLRGEYNALWLEAYDTWGNLFTADQYQFMRLSVQYDTSYVQVALATDPSSLDASESKMQHRQLYEVSGVAVGMARITISAVDDKGVAVTSNTLTVQVFDAFEVVPTEVVLLPGASTQLQWGGGPSEAEVLFSMLDSDDSCSITKEGVIHAHQVGRNTVRATASAVDSVTGKRKVFGTCFTTVNVVLFDGIRVYAPSRTILRGEQVVLRVSGSRGETPFAFGGREVRFHWDSSNPDVAALKPVYREDESAALSVNSEAGFTVHLHGKTAGEARIHVSVLSAPDSFRLESMSASLVVKVVERFEVLSPPELLLGTGSSFTVKTNRDHMGSVSYVLHDAVRSDVLPECVTLDKGTGTISASYHSGTAVMAIHDSSEAGMQSRVILIDVKPIFSIQLLAPTSSQLDGYSGVHHTMPVGSSMIFRVAVRDRVGREFDAIDHATTALAADVDHRDVVSVSINERAHELTVRALKPGVAILRAAIGNTDSLQDFAKIRVGNAITPSSPVVHVGGSISFGISHGARGSLTLSTEAVGVWHTEDAAIATIDRHTGFATTHKPGACVIKHDFGGMSTYTDVSVVEVTRLHMDLSRVPALSNSVSSTESFTGIPAEYFVPVHFFGSLRTADGSSEVPLFDTADVQHQIEHECELEERAWGTAAPDRDITTGEYGCLISLYSPDLVRHRTEPIPDALTVSVWTARGGPRSSERIPYYPAFIITDELGETMHAYLSIARPTISFAVRHGSNVPSVHSTEPTLVTVTALSAGTLPGSTRYEISVAQRRKGFTNVQVEIWASATRQREIILVDFSVAEPSTSMVYPSETESASKSRQYQHDQASLGERAGFWSSLSPVVVIVIIVLLCLLVAFWMSRPARPQSFASGATTTSDHKSSAPKPMLDRTPLAPQRPITPFSAARQRRTTPGTQPRVENSPYAF